MINRLRERKILGDIYQKYSSKSAILLIYAHPGVGKSFLIDNVFSKIDNVSYLRVSVTQQEARETKGIFASELLKSVSKYALETHKFYTINEFIKDIYKKNISSGKIFNDILDIAADLTKMKIAKEKFEYHLNYKKDLLKNILETDNDSSLAILLEYLTYVAEKNNLIICLENIQYANSKFVDFLKELVSRTRKIFIIGEFTIRSSEIEINDFYRKFESENFEIMNLQKLDKRELIGALCCIANQQHFKLLSNMIEKTYDTSSGNLIEFKYWLNDITRKNIFSQKYNLDSIKYDGAVHYIYSNLVNEQKLILWYIATHLGKVSFSIFKKFLHFTKTSEKKALGTIKFLEEFHLIEKQDNLISLAYDSLIELLKEETDCIKFISIANNNWLNFYRDMTISKSVDNFSDISKYDTLILQLTFIVNIGGSENIDWMNHILSEISNHLNNTISHSVISKLINIFNQVIETNTNKDIVLETYEWIVVILSKLGFSEEIRIMMDKYSHPNPSSLLILLQYSARIATCDYKVLDDLQKIKKTDNQFLFIGSQLLLARYYRTFNQINIANEIWMNLIKFNLDTPYANVIYEYANICTPNIKKRLKYLHLAEKGYLLEKNNYHLCSVLLNITANTYYMYLFKIIRRKNFVRIVSNNLEKVKNLLLESYFPLHIYLNQRGIFEMILGEISNEKIINNFKTAYLTCGIIGNRPLIGSNIIASALKTNNIEGIEDYVEELVSISKKYSSLNVEFARYPLLNCYKYFKVKNNRERQKEIITTFTQRKILNNGLDPILRNSVFTKTIFSRVKYYHTNIINWDIDFKNIQNKY